MIKNSHPLVTVYIPTHKRCQLLKRAVDSVLAQYYSNIEVIIVDDASKDETSQYLTELANNHEKIRFFTQSSAKGACAARNIAIKEARGELITGLDDDDEFVPSRITDLVANYDENYAFVCTGFLWHYGKKSRAVDNTEKVISLDEQLHYNYATNQVLVATERLRAISGFDESFVACQDYDTWTRLIKKFGSAKRVAGATYIIHRGDDIERLTKPSNWLNGHDQFLVKHGGDMNSNHLINQKFRRLVLKRDKYFTFCFIKQIKAGLLKDKVRYYLSTNLPFIGRIRRFFIE